MRTHEVFVVVRRGEAFLVAHRTLEQGGYWHCVAGGVEPGESFAAAAARELREETGLAVELAALDRRYVYEGPVTVECFLAEAPSGWEPQLNDEHDGYRWCTLDDACELLYWPEPREVLRTLGR